jgi:catechol 2,3-dioxygenase-like lactoylglutathione lyase family enzyme
MNKNDHTAFQVSNLDASIDFYAESLGLRLLFRDENIAEQEEYAFFELKGGNLELIKKMGVPFVKPSLITPYCPHLALSTNDMNDVLKMIEQHHIQIVKGPLEVPGEEKWIYIADPDNNVIEYIEWIGVKKAGN